jgi:hypothetical protein
MPVFGAKLTSFNQNTEIEQTKTAPTAKVAYFLWRFLVFSG